MDSEDVAACPCLVVQHGRVEVDREVAHGTLAGVGEPKGQGTDDTLVQKTELRVYARLDLKSNLKMTVN